MDRRARSIVDRINKYGLRATCLNCGQVSRTIDNRGWGPGVRIRYLRSDCCMAFMCSTAWASGHQARYEEKVAAEHRRLGPFRNNG